MAAQTPELRTAPAVDARLREPWHWCSGGPALRGDVDQLQSARLRAADAAFTASAPLGGSAAAPVPDAARPTRLSAVDSSSARPSPAISPTWCSLPARPGSRATRAPYRGLISDGLRHLVRGLARAAAAAASRCALQRFDLRRAPAATSGWTKDYRPRRMAFQRRGYCARPSTAGWRSRGAGHRRAPFGPVAAPGRATRLVRTRWPPGTPRDSRARRWTIAYHAASGRCRGCRALRHLLGPAAARRACRYDASRRLRRPAPRAGPGAAPPVCVPCRGSGAALHLVRRWAASVCAMRRSARQRLRLRLPGLPRRYAALSRRRAGQGAVALGALPPRASARPRRRFGWALRASIRGPGWPVPAATRSPRVAGSGPCRRLPSARKAAISMSRQ